jgi:hypothetical protein
LSLTLFTCGICSADTALKDCVLLTELRDEIAVSEIKTMFEELISPLFDLSAKQSSINYAKAAQMEMVDGILKEAKYCCGHCANELTKIYKTYCKNNPDSSLHGLMNNLSVNQASHLFDSESTCNSHQQNANHAELLMSVETNKRRVPKMALVNGHFRGATPLCLSCLTRVELSMVVRINCVYTLTMLKKGIVFIDNIKN